MFSCVDWTSFDYLRSSSLSVLVSILFLARARIFAVYSILQNRPHIESATTSVRTLLYNGRTGRCMEITAHVGRDAISLDFKLMGPIYEPRTFLERGSFLHQNYDNNRLLISVTVCRSLATRLSAQLRHVNVALLTEFQSKSYFLVFASLASSMLLSLPTSLLIAYYLTNRDMSFFIAVIVVACAGVLFSIGVWIWTVTDVFCGFSHQNRLLFFGRGLLSSFMHIPRSCILFLSFPFVSARGGKYGFRTFLRMHTSLSWGVCILLALLPTVACYFEFAHFVRDHLEYFHKET